MVPCFFAYTRRMGPMVESTSAFISTTGFPNWKASRMTWAPNSTEPVTSTTTSISLERQIAKGVIGDDRYASPNGVIERALGVGGDDVVAACIPVHVECPLGSPVVDGGHAHA